MRALPHSFLAVVWVFEMRTVKDLHQNVSPLRFSFQIPKPLQENYVSKRSHVNSKQDTLNFNLMHQNSYDKKFILTVKCNLSINLYIL
jgi:hypothetical protein